MLKYNLILFALITFNFAQTYCAGDQISVSDQNSTHLVGAGYGDFSAGDEFKLADWNGELNGGNYSVIFIDMSASWWGPCQANAPIVDGLETDFGELGVKFVTSLSDAGQPYSSEEWQSNFGNPEAGLVLDANQSSVELFSLLHDSWNAYPTFAILDHTMTVRAKPWTLDNNSNTNSCDGTSTTINGWSGGSTTNFLQQLLDECGSLCEGCSGDVDTDGDGLADECDDCLNMAGDPNDDMTIDVLDIVIVVNIILNGGANSPNFTECQIIDSDMDGNGTINVLDIIQVINSILGQSRFDDVNGIVDVTYDIKGHDLILNFNSDISMSGLELAFASDYLLDVETENNLYLATGLDQDIQRLVTFSMDNNSFNNLDVTIKNGHLLDIEDINMIVSSPVGTQIATRWNVAEIQTFKLTDLQPNPFNPVTQIQYEVYNGGDIQLSVYNILGQEVASLYQGYMHEGNHAFTWDASNLSSGVYYVSMMMNSHVETMKAMLIK